MPHLQQQAMANFLAAASSQMRPPAFPFIPHLLQQQQMQMHLQQQAAAAAAGVAPPGNTPSNDFFGAFPAGHRL